MVLSAKSYDLPIMKATLQTDKTKCSVSLALCHLFAMKVASSSSSSHLLMSNTRLHIANFVSLEYPVLLAEEQSRPANQSEQTGLWFQTEGEKRCCSTDCMREINTFLNIKAYKHVTVTVEAQNTIMNMKMSRIWPL